MLRNFIKTAVRNISRNKLYASVSILGLGIGLGVCLLALQYLTYEFSFDNIKEGNRVYEVVIRMQIGGNSPGRALVGGGKVVLGTAAPPKLITTMKSYFSGIESGVSIYPLSIALPVHGRPDISAKFWSAGQEIFNILDLHLIGGDEKTCLLPPNSIVLSQSLALKYFGTTDVVGKTIEIQTTFQGTHDCLVTGVMKDIPKNSSYSFDALGSGMIFSGVRYTANANFTWGTHIPGVLHFVKLRKEVDARTVTGRMASFVKSTGGIPDWQSPVLVPMKQIHFRTDIDNGFSTYEQKYLYILAGVALLVLIVSAFNFLGINLTLFSRRLREIGVRRVIGAKGPDLTAQFLVENILLTSAAFVLAFCLAELVLPVFDSMMGLNLSPDFLARPISLALIVVLVLILNGVLSIYSNHFFTRPDPQALIRGQVAESYLRLTTRQVLSSFQFAVGAFLICCALVVIDQLNFVGRKDLRFNPKDVLVISRDSFGTGSRALSVLKTELKRDPNIVDVTSTLWVPGENNERFIFAMTAIGGKYKESVTLHGTAVDANFASVLDLQFVRGRNFNPLLASDSGTVIVNEEAVQELGVTGPQSDSIQFLGNKWRLVGVVKDFNYQSLRHEVEPLVLNYGKDFFHLALRFRKGSEKEVLAYLDRTWKEVYPTHRLDYYFLQDRINEMYSKEDRMFTALMSGSVLAIAIALMGIFALSSFLVETKTKEIAVRKVLGSSVSGIVRLISGDFLKMVVIANVIAWPAAYLVVHDWLQNYAYRVKIDLFVFPLVGITMMVLALLTVILRALKVARANPVEALRYE